MEDHQIQDITIGVNWKLVFKAIRQRKSLFYKTLPVTFVLACLFIICIPRYYQTEIKLAPEMENSGAGGALSSIASSFGFDLGEMQTSDAITPLLYPDLMEDNGFVASLFAIPIETKDKSLKTTYHDYLKSYQQYPWWTYIISWITSPFTKKDSIGDGALDPYRLPKSEDKIAKKIRDKIHISVDKKTAVITISVEAQDPLVCKTVADSTKNRLQTLITNYRTNKARTDYEYYKGLVDDAKQEYEKARKVYGGTADANTRVALRSVELRLEDMENDMQLKFNTYTTLNNQLQAAKAKVQERTPAFTVIKGAAVPVKPAGPKRMIFVAVMTIIAFICTSLYVLKNIVKS
jgi:capsule polysaccharide export protein KpsE/RkpR